ncbi:hypothetical protein ANN_03130 [Periplaneta americana]|uniref:Uncharacterized protein n=1 Tax=Periplaneta americana TaxID=6978 RepID=A0ABQ8TYC2_PERAM|nr:hypothetical protein ANN_03130 [Periplaneta americana]
MNCDDDDDDDYGGGGGGDITGTLRANIEPPWWLKLLKNKDHDGDDDDDDEEDDDDDDDDDDVIWSPDLTPLDYCVWGWLKSEVYKHKVELLACILHACAEVNKFPNQLRSATQQLSTRATKLTEHVQLELDRLKRQIAQKVLKDTHSTSICTLHIKMDLDFNDESRISR